MPNDNLTSLREPTEQEIADSDVVAVVFIKARINYLREQSQPLKPKDGRRVTMNNRVFSLLRRSHES